MSVCLPTTFMLACSDELKLKVQIRDSKKPKTAITVLQRYKRTHSDHSFTMLQTDAQSSRPQTSLPPHQRKPLRPTRSQTFRKVANTKLTRDTGSAIVRQ